MLWPERPDTWREGAKPAQAAFAAIATAIACGEPVTVGVSAAQFQNARARLPREVRVVEMSSNDAWIRDSGPTFVIDAKGRRRGVDWTFNAWGGLAGGLYFPWDRDDEVAQKVLRLEGADRYRTRFVLEGGAIHVDGQGTCLTTEECLLNPNRNPDLTRADIEETLAPLSRRDHGDLARRAESTSTRPAAISMSLRALPVPGRSLSPGPRTARTRNMRFPAMPSSACAMRAMRAAAELTIHKIHQPGPLYMTAEEAAGIDVRSGTHPRRAGDRLPASYINFYVANKCVVMPQYDKRWDAAACARSSACSRPARSSAIATREVLLGGGNIHCITQQVPRAAPR